MKQILILSSVAVLAGMSLLFSAGSASAGEDEDDGTTTPMSTMTTSAGENATMSPTTNATPGAGGGATTPGSTPTTGATPEAGGAELPSTGTGPGADGSTSLAWLLMGAGFAALAGAVALGYANRSRPL